MTKVILTRQAASDIKNLYDHLRNKFGRNASEYIKSDQKSLLMHVSDGRFMRKFDEYQQYSVYIYTTEKGRQNYYYRIVGNDIELLHVSSHFLRNENVIGAISVGISNGRSDHSIMTLLRNLDALE